MGIFSFMFDTRPGPGVQPDEPRKTGFSRYAEVVSRDSGKFFLSGVLAILGVIPMFMGIRFALDIHSVIAVVFCGLAGGMIAAPQLSALADTILHSLRDEPVISWWYGYSRAWRRDVKASLLPGALTGISIEMQVFALSRIPIDRLLSVYTLAVLLSILLTTAIGIWLWAQVPLLELGFATILKNAVLLCLLHLPRSLGASIAWMLYIGIIALLWPPGMVVLMLGNLWLPASIGLLMIYIPLNRNFHIEEELDKRV